MVPVCLNQDLKEYGTIVDKAPRRSISIVICILSSDTETSAATPLGGGARKVLVKLSHFWGFNLAGKGKLALPRI